MDFEKYHKMLFGEEPTEKQLTVYNNFPMYRGIFSDYPDEELFKAVFLMGLAGTFKTEAEPAQVAHLFLPIKYHAWAKEQFAKFARQILIRVHQSKATEGQMSHVKGLFNRLVFGSNFDTSEPQHWVAFGFEKTSKIPTPVKKKMFSFQEGSET
jgi:hypothetical protein